MPDCVKKSAENTALIGRLECEHGSAEPVSRMFDGAYNNCCCQCCRERAPQSTHLLKYSRRSREKLEQSEVAVAVNVAGLRSGRIDTHRSHSACYYTAQIEMRIINPLRCSHAAKTLEYLAHATLGASCKGQ